MELSCGWGCDKNKYEGCTFVRRQRPIDLCYAWEINDTSLSLNYRVFQKILSLLKIVSVHFLTDPQTYDFIDPKLSNHP